MNSEILQFCYGKEGQFIKMKKILESIGETPLISNTTREYKSRILLIAEKGSGKTFLIEKLLNHTFSEYKPEPDVFLTIYETSPKSEIINSTVFEYLVIFLYINPTKRGEKV